MNTASVRGDKAIRMVAFGKIATNQALAEEPRRFSKRLGQGEPLPRAWEEQATFSHQHLTRIRGDVVNLLRMDIKPVRLAAYLDAAGVQFSNGKPWTAGGVIALIRALKIAVPSRRKPSHAGVSSSPKSVHDLQPRRARKKWFRVLGTSMPDTLYEQDFYRWTQEQASALRRAAQEGANLPVDWENVAEEIEDLGTAHRSELRNRLRTIIEHFLKLCHSPAVAPRAGWRETVQRSRLEIEDVLSASPSLRRELPELAEQARRGALKIAAAGLRAHGETSAEVLSELGTASYTFDQLLGDWFPPEPDRT